MYTFEKNEIMWENSNTMRLTLSVGMTEKFLWESMRTESSRGQASLPSISQRGRALLSASCRDIAWHQCALLLVMWTLILRWKCCLLAAPLESSYFTPLSSMMVLGEILRVYENNTFLLICSATNCRFHWHILSGTSIITMMF